MWNSRDRSVYLDLLCVLVILGEYRTLIEFGTFSDHNLLAVSKVRILIFDYL